MANPSLSDLVSYRFRDSVPLPSSGGLPPLLGTIAGKSSPIARQPKLRQLPSRDSAAYRFALLQTAARLVPEQRVANCLRLPFDSRVELHSSTAQGGGAFYRNLQTCGSPWACPVCSSKISSGRRVEAQAAIDKTIQAGGSVYMATFTLRHKSWDDIEDVLATAKAAHKYMKNGKAWQSACDRFHLIGTIRALETTYGLNGFHPHFHELYFLSTRLTRRQEKAFRAWLSSRWTAAVHARGGDCNEHGCEIQRDIRSADYLDKLGGWQFGDEVAMGIRKKSRSLHSGTTMPMLLHMAAEGHTWAGRVWSEYARAFKGEHQLHWSRGLRWLLFGDDGFTPDETLAAATPASAGVVCSFPWSEWRKVCIAQQRGELLDLVSASNWIMLSEFLAMLDVEYVDICLPSLSPPEVELW